jgi:predicted phosphoribosyltransferase
MPFRNRADAGRKLAKGLASYNIPVGPLWPLGLMLREPAK